MVSISNMKQLLSIADEKVNILEEEIDVQVQKEYFALLNKLNKNVNARTQLTQEYIERLNDLFDDTIDIEVKKEMLILLAAIDDVTIYRTIEHLSKQDSPIQKWATIALQQARMILQSSLLDDPGYFISTGLGGQGSLLRYFCVFPYRNKEELADYQKNILKNELALMLQKQNGSFENIEFYNRFSTASLLMPLKTDIPQVLADVIDECNIYGHFLVENILVTNVKKFTEEEILQLLDRKTDLKS